MRAGTLRERITVQRLPARDDWGERGNAWTDVGTYRASVTATGGKEGPATGGTASSTAYTVRVRYSPATSLITTADRIGWRGITIDITAAVANERRTEILITGVAHA